MIFQRNVSKKTINVHSILFVFIMIISKNLNKKPIARNRRKNIGSWSFQTISCRYDDWDENYSSTVLSHIIPFEAQKRMRVLFHCFLIFFLKTESQHSLVCVIAPKDRRSNCHNLSCFSLPSFVLYGFMRNPLKREFPTPYLGFPKKWNKVPQPISW